MDLKHQKLKILITCLSGIGNTILFTPALRILRKQLPKASITLLVREKSFASCIRDSDFVDEVIVFNGSIIDRLRKLRALRKVKYDISLTTFPSNRYEFNLFAWLIGAQRRITHRYKVGNTLANLQTEFVPVDEKLHDVENNLNLLEHLGINTEKEKRELIFETSKEDEKKALEFIRSNKLQKSWLIGMHPGTSKTALYRRWPSRSFSQLCNNILNDYEKAHILLFEGPDEAGLAADILRGVDDKSRVTIAKDMNLNEVAALIWHCKLFVSTDSGLGHIAAAKNIPVVVLFGPANPNRTRPWGKKVAVIQKGPILIKYPFYSTNPEPEGDYRESLEKITVEDVMKEVERFL
ncbi:glycosyltransferase family 9 protein [Candidatus Woesearchaeota archaeon]|nr:glycosyltransferase family 9 protein [Candidatus Woesearchaeota archaeon]